MCDHGDQMICIIIYVGCIAHLQDRFLEISQSTDVCVRALLQLLNTYLVREVIK